MHVMHDIEPASIIAHGLRSHRIGVEYFEPKIPIEMMFLALFLVLVGPV